MPKHLLIFARQPVLGQVKTRLAAHIGPGAALQVYQELLQRTRRATDGVNAQKTVWLVADKEVRADNTATDIWQHYAQQIQPEGDLGQRMHHAFATSFAVQAEAVVIIGTDCPGLTAAHLQQAFDQLRTHDIVLGPALDGGYYLLGMKALRPDLFLNKTWSTATVLADTVADAERLGLSLALLPSLQDVDTVEDLAAWRSGER